MRVPTIIIVCLAISYAIAWFLSSFCINASVGQIAPILYLPSITLTLTADYWRWLHKNYLLQINQLQPEPAPSVIDDEFIEKCATVVTCPCGEADIPAIIFVNDENILTCTKCSSKFRVELIPQTILVTEPQNIEKMFDILKSKVDLEKRNSSKIEEDGDV